MNTIVVPKSTPESVSQSHAEAKQSMNDIGAGTQATVAIIETIDAEIPTAIRTGYPPAHPTSSTPLSATPPVKTDEVSYLGNSIIHGCEDPIGRRSQEAQHRQEQQDRERLLLPQQQLLRKRLLLLLQLEHEHEQEVQEKRLRERSGRHRRSISDPLDMSDVCSDVGICEGSSGELLRRRSCRDRVETHAFRVLSRNCSHTKGQSKSKAEGENESNVCNRRTLSLDTCSSRLSAQREAQVPPSSWILSSQVMNAIDMKNLAGRQGMTPDTTLNF
jgi:hypothetical protein